MASLRSYEEYGKILESYTKNSRLNNVKFGFVVQPKNNEVFASLVLPLYSKRFCKLFNLDLQKELLRFKDGGLCGKEAKIDRVMTAGFQEVGLDAGISLQEIAGTQKLHDRFYNQVGPILDKVVSTSRGSANVSQTLLRSFDVVFCAKVSNGIESKIFMISKASSVVEQQGCSFTEWMDLIQRCAQWLIDNFVQQRVGELKDPKSKTTNNMIKAMYLAFVSKI